MFGLSYNSRENHELLRKLEDRLSKSTDLKQRNETLLEINSIREQSKLYTECNLEELQDLRGQLLEKMQIVQRLGKGQSVEVFRYHLKDVDFQIQTVRMQEAQKDESRPLRPDAPPGLKDRPPSLNQLKKQRDRARYGDSRWMVDMDEEDEDDD